MNNNLKESYKEPGLLGKILPILILLLITVFIIVCIGIIVYGIWYFWVPGISSHYKKSSPVNEYYNDYPSRPYDVMDVDYESNVPDIVPDPEPNIPY